MKTVPVGKIEVWVHTATPQRYQGDLVVIQEVIHQDAYKLGMMPKTATGAEVVVDVGAHIGTFCKRLRLMNKTAKYYGVEVCPENWPVLKKNACGKNDQVFQMAIDYGGPKALLNSVIAPNVLATGGSIVIDRERAADHAYRPASMYAIDRRTVAVSTLSEFMERVGIAKIDILKLDCEGAEKRILLHDREAMQKVRHVVGEYHGADFFEIVDKHYPEWSLHTWRGRGNIGPFWLFHPDRFAP